MQSVLAQLKSGTELSFDDAKTVMERLIAGAFTDDEIAAFLLALKDKGETADEVAGFASALRAAALPVAIDGSVAVDCCGTGGDGSGSFNISTAAALIAAAAGAKVAKHGNRSVSSKCGSADLLERTGVRIDPGPEQVASDFSNYGICFMFAPRFHPGIRYAMPARRALGVRTVFNMLGPLLNPASVSIQLLGVYDRGVMNLFAESLLRLGVRRALIVSSADGLDEISTSADTLALEIRDREVTERVITVNELGVRVTSGEDISGGGPEENFALLEALLAGEPVGPRPAALANAGAVVYLAGNAESIREGVERCEEALDSGAARRLLTRWVG